MKRLTLLLLLAAATIPSIAQDLTVTKYLNKIGDSTGKENAIEYCVTTYTDTTKQIYTSRTYFINGKLKSEYSFHDSNAVPLIDGNFIVNHDNGQLKMKGRFVKGKLQGEVMTWHENGQIKRKDEYVLDSLTNGHCYTATGQDTTWYPFYTGFNYGNDIKELYKFVGRNIKYPKEARKKWIEGEVRIQFIIEKDGTLTNEKIIRSVNDQIDQEGLRVLRAAPARWKPALLDGEPYRGHGVLPIVFRIEP